MAPDWILITLGPQSFVYIPKWDKALKVERFSIFTGWQTSPKLKRDTYLFYLKVIIHVFHYRGITVFG